MRIAKNPARYQKNVYRPARITICVLVCIPEQLGYFQHRLDVLKVCLSSIIQHAPPASYDLLVFDNASQSEVVDFLRSLHRERMIHYLFLSPENLGVANAHRLMFQAAPGEIIAYSDDDVLFRAGWLEAQLAILDTFPKVGLVSGSPVREQFRYGNRYLRAYLAEFPEISAISGRFIPEAWTAEFRLSVGRPAKREKETEREAELTEIVLEYKGVRAYSTATHFQFVAPKAVLLRVLAQKWEKKLMGGQRELDERIDAMGYARLTTVQRYVQHMGNSVAHEFLDSVLTQKLLRTSGPGSRPPPPC